MNFSLSQSLIMWNIRAKKNIARVNGIILVNMGRITPLSSENLWRSIKNKIHVHAMSVPKVYMVTLSISIVGYMDFA